MEKNAWQVAHEVAAMVDDEPGPAGDFVLCYVTTCEKNTRRGIVIVQTM